MNDTKADRTVGLREYGPDSDTAPSLQEAREWCRRLTRTHGENFSVLSSLVRADLVADFSSVYAFCRCADDLGDAAGSSARSSELLCWWRTQLHRCFAGEASHPVFVALQDTLSRRCLGINLFEDLISAFELDQSKRRYSTWEELLGYCRLSADPVGRLVLALLKDDVGRDGVAASDAICTALQLTNHWQDVRRDLVERDRIYVPAEAFRGQRFEERLASTCRQGYAPDREFLSEWRETLRPLVERTWSLFEQGGSLVDMVGPSNRGLIWLFLKGGEGTLRAIERWNFETCLVRPRLSGVVKGSLLLRARWRMTRGVPR
ncbi:MAG: squalene synthase HpnC [Phycisphaerales bacterium]|nr:squalene synthase HpnC [Phycisphaerales bacterium]